MPPRTLKINKKELNNCIELCNEYTRMIAVANDELGICDFDIKGEAFDSGDLVTMAYFFNINGNTPEERQADMTRQYKAMREAFLSADPKAKEPYLTMLYMNYTNSYRYLENGINTPQEFVKAVGSALNNQAVAKKRNENLNYFYNEFFDTIDKQKHMMASAFINDTIGSYINRLRYREDGPKLTVRPIFDLEEIGLQINMTFADGCIDAFNKGNMDTITFVVPESADEEAEQEYSVTRGFSTNNAITNVIVSYSGMENSIENKTGYKSDLYKAGPSTYLDGKNLRDIAIEELRQTPEYSDPSTEIPDVFIDRQSHIMLCDAMRKGDKVISVAIPHLINNNVEMSIMKLKPDVSRIHEYELSQRNPLRRLFDWGPFKVKPCQDDVEKVYKNAINHDEEILADSKRQFNDQIERIKKENNIHVNPLSKEAMWTRGAKARQILNYNLEQEPVNQQVVNDDDLIIRINNIENNNLSFNLGEDSKPSEFKIDNNNISPKQSEMKNDIIMDIQIKDQPQ